ncbi:MAG: FemAB-like protein [Candidatus Peregrinibacteria bacterium GW2011_GWF2_43_17]|nr:MAG: FemAB-like protein [Candidatus Peregrinibacteria bacterium GW2011_GWF2_43_17]KKT19664.1 MAG: hypothetical protein UW03_C0015G0040 [Candidatus Peregrinibacteria bacterium GW2011_GWA2_43_8]HAU40046.1 hypothetical protein [Candidatus Peregrinibacteria bacterium]
MLSEGWNKFSVEHDGTIFHKYEWMIFLGKIFRGKDEGIMTKDGLLPIFNKKSLPLADYCGPLGKIKIPDGVEVFSVKKLPGFKVSPFCTFSLKVAGSTYEDILKNTVHQKHRNMIHRAQREGIQVFKFENDYKHLDGYYRLYVRTILRLGRVPLPLRAFHELKKLFANKMELYLAEYDGRFIGGLLTFVYNGRMHVWGNCSNEKFSNFGVNNALYAFAIKRACETKLNEVDFGSSLKGSTHAFFKSRFGGEEMPIYYRGDDDFRNLDTGFMVKMVVSLMKIVPWPGVSFISAILHKIK